MAENRADSAHVMAKIYGEALKGIEVPDCVSLEPKEMPFWYAITEARAQWTKVDLISAANLARCLCSIEENQNALRIEGDVIENTRGTPIMNPRFTILEQLSRRSASLMQKLQVHALATVGMAKDQRKKNSVKSNALASIDDMDDDLIARPN